MPELLQLLGFALLGIGAGVSFVVQQALNANLRACLESASWAAFISYLGGTLTMLIVLLVMRESWLSGASVARSSWWLWTGGFFGAIYIVVAIALLPRLGAATVVALIVTGQMLASLAFDHLGLLGLTQQPVSLPRLAGALLLIAGVVLIRL
ncbi:MAG: DMT family transporter [Proteobacteria bacterium]|nr:DMT family transporter [Pseudomonadota bacterium]MBU0967710.1 DMT family transporter [Pseudomonadota bacterium]